jgi:hypothetical protein
VIDRQGRDGGGAFIFTVALSAPDDVQSLVAAAAAGSLTVVRTTAVQPVRSGD